MVQGQTSLNNWGFLHDDLYIFHPSFLSKDVFVYGSVRARPVRALQRTLPMSKSSVQFLKPWAVSRTTKFGMRTNPISTLFFSCIPQCNAPRRSEIGMADWENNGCFFPLSHRRSACIPAEGFLRVPLPQTELQEPCCVFSLIFVRNFACESFEMIEILRWYEAHLWRICVLIRCDAAVGELSVMPTPIYLQVLGTETNSK